MMVLNLVISGIPSILSVRAKLVVSRFIGFKPCYKWNTFNTILSATKVRLNGVLNLVISGIPSIQKQGVIRYEIDKKSFKPCYKWNTFNT